MTAKMQKFELENQKAVKIVQSFEKDVRLIQSQYKGMIKDIKNHKDKTGEELFNIENRLEEFIQNNKNEQIHYQNHVEDHLLRFQQ